MAKSSDTSWTLPPNPGPGQEEWLVHPGFIDLLKQEGAQRMAKSMKLGGGGRFAALKKKIQGKGKSGKAAGAIAAAIGRKKYGKKAFGKMAAAGRKKAR